MLKTKDSEGYGTQFRTIPKFNVTSGSSSSMLTWVSFSIISNCKELWYIIVMHEEGFRTSDKGGWILTSIQCNCCMILNIEVETEASMFHLFDIDIMRQLFYKYATQENFKQSCDGQIRLKVQTNFPT